MAAEQARPLTFLVYGAGAVGSLLGARLAASGQHVTLLGRPAIHRVITEHGLRVDDAAGSSTIHLPVVASIDELTTQPDVVLLTVKAYSVDRALPDLARLGGSGATIVSIQNGIGIEERLLETPDIHRVIAASLTISVGADGPNRVRQETSSGGLGVAAVRDLDALVDPLCEAFTRAGVPSTAMPDYRAMKWSKLLLNILANATSAILAVDPGVIFADPALFAVEQRAFIETLGVMGGQGLTPLALPGFNVPLLVYAMRLPPWLSRRLVGPRVASGRGDKRPSLWIDVDGGRGDTEIGWLNGAVARQGETLGIPTPVNRALTTLVEQIARDPAKRAELAGHPRLLLEAIAAQG